MTDVTSRTGSAPPVEDGGQLSTLRTLNLAVGAAHLVQAVVILILENDFSIPVVAPVQTGPPGTELTESRTFFDLTFKYGVAAFLLLAAIDHLLTAGPLRRWYERNLSRKINPARWLEYSISASIMVVLIAMLPGITNAYALLALFGVNAAMILFGWVMEQVNEPGRGVRWSPFVFGCVAGAVPWVTVAVALWSSSSEGDGVPGFVYGIFVSLFVFFNCFALNQWLQYRGAGRFGDYLFGERVYLLLSLGAKSALAWQVYAGTLPD